MVQAMKSKRSGRTTRKEVDQLINASSKLLGVLTLQNRFNRSLTQKHAVEATKLLVLAKAADKFKNTVPKKD